MSNLALLKRIGKLCGLASIALALAGCGGGGDGGDSDGGFVGARDTLDIVITADKTRVPANVTFEGPDPNGIFTSNITVRVTDEQGRLFPAESITISMAPVSIGSLFYLDGEDDTTDDNGNPRAFRRQVFEDTDGIVTSHFHPGSETGTVELTATVVDPVSGTAQTDSITIEIFDDQDRTPTSIRFTGAFVNAVLSFASAFGDATTIASDGTYQRVISVVVSDADGQPVRPRTQVQFFLIDSPLEGFPGDGPGRFEIAGPDGDPLEGGTFFNADSGEFVSEGVLPFDRLILDGRERSGRDDAQLDNRDLTGIYTIDTVLSETQLRVRESTPFANNRGGDNGETVPYVVGRAERATILSRAFTDATGVATTLLTYPVDLVGRTAILAACTTDRSICTILNTCDANGANCARVFLPVSDGTNVTITSSDTTLGPNTSTPVQLCLNDVNFTPIQATPIRYDIPGGTGTAVITVNGSTALSGTIPTGADGCATVVIETSGQAPGTEPISIFFDAEGVAEPLEIMILGPGAGNLSGTVACDGEGAEEFALFQQARGLYDQCVALGAESPGQLPAECQAIGFGFTTPSGDDDPQLITPLPPSPPASVECTVTLFLQDDRGGPIPGITITVGDTDGSLGDITFDPQLGANSGITDENGENEVSVVFGTDAVTEVTFVAGGAEFTYSLDLSVDGD